MGVAKTVLQTYPCWTSRALFQVCLPADNCVSVFIQCARAAIFKWNVHDEDLGKNDGALHKWKCCLQINETTLEITELPIRKWTQDYKEFLDGLIKPDDKNATPTIVEYKEHHSNINVHFVVEVTAEKMAELVAAGLEKEFKLTSKISTGTPLAPVSAIPTLGLRSSYTCRQHDAL
jgi:hypothetical protein